MPTAWAPCRDCGDLGKWRRCSTTGSFGATRDRIYHEIRDPFRAMVLLREIPFAILDVGGVAEIAGRIDAALFEPDPVMHTAGVALRRMSEVDIRPLKTVPRTVPRAKESPIVDMRS